MIDGFVEIHRGVVIFPWVTIGLRAGDVRGRRSDKDVHIGTGAKVIGPVTVHKGARIGANAVVVADVAAGTTVVGAPALAGSQRHRALTIGVGRYLIGVVCLGVAFTPIAFGTRALRRRFLPALSGSPAVLAEDRHRAESRRVRLRAARHRGSVPVGTGRHRVRGRGLRGVEVRVPDDHGPFTGRRRGA